MYNQVDSNLLNNNNSTDLLFINISSRLEESIFSCLLSSYCCAATSIITEISFHCEDHFLHNTQILKYTNLTRHASVQINFGKDSLKICYD